MKLLFTTAALAACAIALPAAAQSTSGDAWWNPMGYVHNSYVELDGGTTTGGRVNRSTSTEASGVAKVSGGLSDDAFGSMVFGHNITDAIALEGEGFYAYNHYNFDAFASAVPGEHSQRTYGGFANVKLRAPFAAHVWSLGINPYVAGGIGYGDVEYTKPSETRTGRDGFMWQGKAGLEVKTGTPVSFDLGYRYIQAPDDERRSGDGLSSTLVRSNIQAATLGVRYTF